VDKRDLRNYGPVAINAALYKVFLTIVRGRMERWLRRKGFWMMCKVVLGRGREQMTICLWWIGCWRCVKREEI
jgi:hypothetical protein